MIFVSFNSIMTGITGGAGTANSPQTPEFLPSFWWGSCCSIFSLCSVNHCLSFSFWSLNCLSFDLHNLITSLVTFLIIVDTKKPPLPLGRGAKTINFEMV